MLTSLLLTSSPAIEQTCPLEDIFFLLHINACTSFQEATLLRTHHCGELRAEHADTTTTLCGWVHNIRDFGGTKFIVLRDRWGITQITVGPQAPDDVQQLAGELRDEFVVKVTGQVHCRPEGQANPKMATGDIEVLAQSMEILNRSQVPPFTPGQQELPHLTGDLHHKLIAQTRRQHFVVGSIIFEILAGQSLLCSETAGE